VLVRVIDDVVQLLGVLVCVTLAGVGSYCFLDGASGSGQLVLWFDVWITAAILCGPHRPTREHLRGSSKD
jgi:hypothetical protein